jgi:phosphate/sulfate permease
VKALFYSVLGAVLSAILIYFAQDYIQEQKKSSARVVRYEVEDNLISMDKSVLMNVASSADQFADTVTFAKVTVENAGTDAISNQTAVFRTGSEEPVGKGILRQGSLELPGKDPDSVSMKASKNRLDLTYKLLNAGEKHSFWVAYNDVGVPSFTMRTPGLTLEEGLKEEADDDGIWDLGNWLLLVIALGVAFLAGVVSFYASISSELKARGFDLDEMAKAPKLEQSSSAGSP